jgi:hypothetical protein
VRETGNWSHHYPPARLARTNTQRSADGARRAKTNPLRLSPPGGPLCDDDATTDRVRGPAPAFILLPLPPSSSACSTVFYLSSGSVNSQTKTCHGPRSAPSRNPPPSLRPRARDSPSGFCAETLCGTCCRAPVSVSRARRPNCPMSCHAWVRMRRPHGEFCDLPHPEDRLTDCPVPKTSAAADAVLPRTLSCCSRFRSARLHGAVAGRPSAA